MEQHRRTFSEQSVDVQVLIKRLAPAAVGETVTYAELSQLIRRDVQRKSRHLLVSARRRLENDEHIIFDVIANEGLKRADDACIVAGSKRGIQHIRNTARKVTRRLTYVEYDNLSDEQKRTHNVCLAQAGVLAHMTKTSVVQRIESKVPDAASTVPARFLEAIRETL